jgi:hypothetical protein
MDRKRDSRESKRQLTKRSSKKAQNHGVSNTREQGFRSFFTPSPQLTAALLHASLNTSIGEIKGYGILGRRLRASLSQFAQSDPQILARINTDIARCLWRYLGALGQRQREHLLTSAGLTAGLQERLGLPQETFSLVQSLTEEFLDWLKYDCRGRFLARWGEIVLSEDEILLKSRPEQRERLENPIPTHVICNYIAPSGSPEANADENEQKIVTFLRSAREKR